MNPSVLLKTAIEPAMTLLPEGMNSPQARRMLIAIALQESGLSERRQIARWEDGKPIHGPARGWWQFEGGGIIGVLRHKATSQHIARVCHDLGYADADPSALHRAVEHNDVLAACFARLNLYWLPVPLPETQAEGWAQYVEAWRPGAVTQGGERARKHKERWPGSWNHD